MRHPFLLACLLLSGFAGLAYELLWVRMLTLSLGSTTLSYSTVLAVFFGGLALGAWLAGRRSARIARPIRAYALIEIATGIIGLALYPVLSNLGGFFASLDPGTGAGGLLLRFVVAAGLLLVPTVLMGATLPIISRAMVVRDEDVGRGTALIYGFNTLGAFLGVYAVTYHLLYDLGVFRSVLLTVGVNMVVGIVALAGERSSGAEALPPAAPDPAPPAPGLQKSGRVAVALTFLGGFAAIALQVVWVRLFGIVLDGTVYGVGSVLIAVLFGIGLGSLASARLVERVRHPGLWFVLLQVATILGVVGLMSAFPWVAYELRVLGWDRSSALGPLHAQLAVVFLAILVPACCSGASFPLLMRIVERRAESSGRTLGELYAANTVGSISGSVLTGFLLIPETGSEATTFLALILTAVVGSLAALFLTEGAPRPLRLGALVLPIAVVPLYTGFDIQSLAVTVRGTSAYPQYRQAQQAQKNSQVLFAEGKVAVVSTYESAGWTSLTLNGLGQGSRSHAPPHHVLESLLVAAVPLAHQPSPDRALVVGLGAGVTVDALRHLGAGHIEVVELEPKVVDAVRAIFPSDNPLDAPNVKVVIDDARHQLAIRARTQPGSFELITSMPAHPWVASSIFTREFFELAKANLAPKGVFCTWFGTGRMDAEASKSLLRAFTSAFGEYAIYWLPEASAYFLVGSNQPLSFDRAHLARLFGHPLLQRREIEHHLYLPVRIYASGTAGTPPPPAGVVNTDDSAFVELHAPRSSTTSPVLRSFMPAEHLVPELVPEAGRAAFLEELLEALLGTPGGRLPSGPTQARLPLAERQLRASEPFLGPHARSYFAGRSALAQSKSEEARPLLEAASADPALRARALKFHALTFPEGSAERRAHLEALEPAGDVLLKLLDHDRAVALAHAPAAAPDPAADPEAWLVWLAAHGPAELSDAARDAFERHVAQTLAKSDHVGLLTLCAELGERRRFASMAGACGIWRQRAEGGAADRLVRRGGAAGAKGDFREAARLLSDANRLRPGNLRTQELLLRSFVEIGDEGGVKALIAELRAFALDEERIEHLVKVAREGKLGASALEEEKERQAAPPTEASPERPGE